VGLGRLLIVAGLVAAAGCAEGNASGDSPTGEASISVVDATGTVVELSGVPDRIVSLVPSATRTLMELGAVGRLAGRTRYDTLASLAEVPSVGGGLHPSMERLLSLQPDVVIRFAGDADADTPRRLDELGIPHLAVRPETVADVREMIGTLGSLVDREAAAQGLVQHIDSTLQAIRREARDREPVPTAFVAGGDPPWVAGSGTYVGELIRIAGGRNVFDHLPRPWGSVSPEALVESAPLVLLVARGVSLDPRIIRETRVRELPRSIQLPGPGLPEAARAVARALHGPPPGA
jgi:iron complex transport system substrate-binding protein